VRGSIQKRSKNSYSIVVDIGKDPETGKRKQKRRTVRGNKKDAEKVLAEMLDQINKGIYFEPSKMTFADYLDYWLEQNKDLAPRTYESYNMIVNKHLKPSLGQLKLEDIKPYHLKDYYNKAQRSGRKDKKGKSLSPTTVNYHHRVIKKALNDAVAEELLVKNPAIGIKPPKKASNEMNVLSDQDVNRLLSEVKGSYLYMPIFIAISTGMRAGEILGLKWEAIDLEAKTINVYRTLQVTKEGLTFKKPKTKGSERCIEISDHVVKVLKNHKAQQSKRKIANPKAYQDDDLVCCWEDGSKINPGTLSSRFHQVVKKLGFNVRFHDLRHSHATKLLKKGVHVKIVSERLGHRNITLTLDTYSHVLPGMQKEAANLFDENYFGKDVTNS